MKLGSLKFWLSPILVAVASGLRSSWRFWLFRLLVALAAGLMVRSFIMPWWSADVSHYLEGPIGIIKIYAYGLSHTLSGYAGYVAADETPFYQTVLAWVYLAANVGLILFSMSLKGKKSTWLLGGVGLIYMAYAAIAAIYIAIRAGGYGDFGIPLQGWGTIKAPEMGDASVHTTLRFGYYLAYCAGLMCIVLSLLRNKIIGKAKTGM